MRDWRYGTPHGGWRQGRVKSCVLGALWLGTGVRKSPSLAARKWGVGDSTSGPKGQFVLMGTLPKGLFCSTIQFSVVICQEGEKSHQNKCCTAWLLQWCFLYSFMFPFPILLLYLKWLMYMHKHCILFWQIVNGIFWFDIKSRCDGENIGSVKRPLLSISDMFIQLLSLYASRLFSLNV